MNQINKEWEEYKILQDKLDKIGDFRFKVRGWTITVISAVVTGGFIGNMTPFFLILPLLLVFIFQLLEKNQDIWQEAFSKRVFRLERQISRKPNESPRIARSIRERHSEVKHGGWFDKLALYAYPNFFIGMYFLIILVLLLKLFLSQPQPNTVVKTPVIKPLSATIHQVSPPKKENSFTNSNATANPLNSQKQSPQPNDKDILKEKEKMHPEDLQFAQ
ncbi:hypothetical protein [Candidatus Nitrospira allomarina]|uniref:Uncharacterized protein n=1 Tax=Candidatus Nitrospira allomarina TaxID=3020900 RepID=A0AA96JSN2_9BACT|nr:hypothetical protein [Candidatus Nitrospira allomarina]WNM58752.1 hypothetical protein PP769_03010 [Candidatus Nitrospira allomarina]